LQLRRLRLQEARKRSLRRSDEGERGATDVQGRKDGEEFLELQGKFLHSGAPSHQLNYSVQAAHPEWQPTDPSGSLYLSKMADFNSARNAMRRRLPEATSAMVIAERRLAERMAHEKAMRFSHHTGLSRRNTGLGKAGLPMGESILSGPPSPATKHKTIPSIDDSVKAVDESAINPFPPPEAQDIHPQDLVEDGGVGSELGESYVDGKVARASGVSGGSQQHDSDRLEDGGMLGLLAQVYGGRGGGFGGGL